MKPQIIKNEQLKTGIIFFIIFSFLLLTLFQHFEIEYNNWGYWVFGRIFAETGKLPVLERAPLYAIYLSLFRLIPYPYSVTLEYLVTTMFTVISLIMFLSPYLSFPLSAISIILWLPNLQLMTPNVQKIALALTCWAVIVRQKFSGRLGITLSYLLMTGAYVFRPTYRYYIYVYIIFDIIYFVKHTQNNRISTFFKKMSLKTDWPIGIIIGLFLTIWILQSPHRWNNVYWATTTWFPYPAKVMNLLPYINCWYITKVLGYSVGNDWYFTNQEAFKGATTNLEVLMKTPNYLFRMITDNFKDGLPMIINMTLLPRIIPNIFNQSLIQIVIFISIILGAFLMKKDRYLTPFILGHLGVILLISAVTPSPHYFISMIPILTFSGYWWGLQIAKVFKIRQLLKTCILILFIGIFISGPAAYAINPQTDFPWLDLIRTLYHESQNHTTRILEQTDFNNSYSWKASYKEIVPLLGNCHGILSEEYNYFAAFTNIPLDRFYDIWEIPPFDYLDHSAYTGLKPERINCVLISKYLQLSAGTVTSAQMRYDLYIRPYADKLISLGAKKFLIPKFGEVYILDQPK